MRRRYSQEDVDRVCMHIEYCMMNYKRKENIIEVIASEDAMEPDFIQMLWAELEYRNQEFFKEYNRMLAVIAQVNRFNSLLSRQVELMAHNNLQQGPSGSGPMHQRNELMHRHNGFHPNSGLALEARPVHRSNGFQQRSNASQQVQRMHQPRPNGFQLPMHQPNEIHPHPDAIIDELLMQHDNELQQRSNASQQVQLTRPDNNVTQQAQRMHQHNGIRFHPIVAQHAPQQMPRDNGLLHHSSATQPAELVHPYNGLQQHPSFTQHAQQLMQRGNELYRHSNGFEQAPQQGMPPHNELRHLNNGLGQTPQQLMQPDNVLYRHSNGFEQAPQQGMPPHNELRHLYNGLGHTPQQLMQPDNVLYRHSNGFEPGGANR